MNYDYDSGILRCKICAKEFFAKQDVEAHYREVHSDEVTSVGE